MIHFSTGAGAMRFYDAPLEIGAVIGSGTCQVWLVEQPSQVEGLGPA
jgi:hypothetical protein